LVGGQHVIVRQFQALFGVRALAAVGDAELLERFLARSDDESASSAFEALLVRHGPMVLRVCRSILRDPNDVDDAFQATFIVLIKRARLVRRRNSVASWLYGVAMRVASAARASSARRRLIEQRGAEMATRIVNSMTTDPCLAVDLGAPLREEIELLPERFRAAVVLCYLEGLTHEEAADHLRWPVGTVRSRLARAREKLRGRLARRGLAPSDPAALVVIAPLALPANLIRSTTNVALGVAAGGVLSAGVVPATVAALIEGVLRNMLMTKLKMAVPLLCVITATVVIAAQTSRSALVGEPGRASPVGRSPIGEQDADRKGAKGAASDEKLDKRKRGADAPASRRATRILQGRVTDAQGQPVREGKVMFAPQTPPVPFAESGMALIDGDGRYRITLSATPFGSEPSPATGLLRYLVLAPGYRGEVGKVDAGFEPATLDIRLSAEAWRTTELRLVDRDGKSIPKAEVTLQMGGPFTWSRETSDAEGRCRVRSAPGQSFSIAVQCDGYLPARFSSRATADDPTSYTVPLYAQIQGRVVDLAGKPLPGIQIGRLIAPNYEAGLDNPTDRLMLYPPLGSTKPATTDAEGRFTLAPTVNLHYRMGELMTWPIAVCFADEALLRVYFLRVDLQGPRRPYEIALRPARQVRIPVEHTVTAPSGPLESWWELTNLAGAAGPDSGVYVMQGTVKRPAPGQDSKDGDWIEAYWPEGNYRIKLNSADRVANVGAEETEGDVVVPSGEGPLLLPPIRMKVLPLQGLVGQPAPEIDATDLDTGSPVKLADFRGKVIVLDFWGYWCGPCIGSMPALMEAHDRFKGKPVAIIALHDQSIQTRDAYDRKLTEVKRQAWSNRALPFQVALDRPNPALAADDEPIGNGITCKRYQIHVFPTTVVIDQEGKVVGTVEVREKGRLDAMIDNLLKNRTAK
jgi:RNA polymerase sigma factor (sigma-70 family)